jgi:integrase
MKANISAKRGRRAAAKTQRVKLTDAFCKSASVREGQRATVYTDSVTRGFCLLVTGNGSKSFAVSYTLRDGDEIGKQKRMVLGPYLGRDGKAVETYRIEAVKIIGRAARGDDAASKRQAQRKGLTVGELVEKYMREHAPKKRSGEVDRQRFARYVIPAWKGRKAASITRGEINALLVPIEHGDKTHPPRPAEAMALLALIKKLYAFGLDAEVVAHHPCVRMKVQTARKVRERELINNPADLRAFWEITTLKFMPANYAAALRFQLLSGTRPNEAVGMIWRELNLEANEWTMPAARIKNKREFLIPLTPTLRAIIDGQPQKTEYVFPAEQGGKYSDKMRRILLARAIKSYGSEGGKLDSFTPHDLRRTAETAMAAAGVHKEYRDRVLNHVDSSVGGKNYNKHDFKSEKRAALESLERYLDNARNAKNDNVTSIRRKGAR